MIVNLITVLSAFGSVFAFLDFLLSKSAKDRLSDYLTRLWFWLANFKGWSLLPLLKRPSYRFAFCAAVVGCVTASLYAVGIDLTFGLPHEMPVAFYYFLLILFLIFVGYDMLENMIEDGPVLSLFLSGGACLFLGFGVDFFWGTRPWLPVALFVILLVFCFSLLAVLPIVVIRLMVYPLKAFELVVRRMAEYEKGPVLACSLVLGAVASGLQIFFH